MPMFSHPVFAPASSKHAVNVAPVGSFRDCQRGDIRRAGKNAIVNLTKEASPKDYDT